MDTTHDRLCAERRDFWTELGARAPALGIAASDGWEKEIPLGLEGRVRMVVSVSQDKTSAYLVGRSAPAKAWIADNASDLARALRTVPGRETAEAKAGRWFRKDTKDACVTIRGQWPEAIDWVIAQHDRFSGAVDGVLSTSKGN